MRDLYIVVESFRNSSDLLSSRLASWVAEHLVFAEPKGHLWRHQQLLLWTGLDVEPEIVQIILHLELHWDGNRFSVCMGAKAFKLHQTNEFCFEFYCVVVGALREVGMGCRLP